MAQSKSNHSRKPNKVQYNRAWSPHGWVTIATCSEISLESNYLQTLQSPFDGTSINCGVCCVVCVCVCVCAIISHLHVKLKDPVVHVRVLVD